MALNSSTVAANDTITAAERNNLRLDVIRAGGDSATTGGTANAQTLAVDAQYIAYATGDVFKFIAGASNTGSVTLNVNSLGAKTVKKAGDALIAGEIVSGQAYFVYYDGTDMQLLSNSALGRARIVGSGTFGETIDGTTTPVLVYIKAADGELYKVDADATESTFKFVGFAINSGNDADAAVIVTDGIVGGFAGMTDAAAQFISGTAGERTETPGTYKHKVGTAISATEILIERGGKLKAGILADYDTQNNTNDDSTITLGFRPKLIELRYEIQGHDSAVVTAHFYKSVGIGMFEETTLISNHRLRFQVDVGGGDDANVSASGSAYNMQPSNQPIVAGTNGANASEKRMAITVPTVTDDGFVIRKATSGGADPGATARARISWVAWGY